MSLANPAGILLAFLMILPAAEDHPAWDLAPLPGVQADNALLTGLVEDLRTAPFDSQKVEDAVRDLSLAENRQHGVPILCAAMARPDFTNLFGPVQVAIRLFKDGQKTLATRMLPFLATVSEHATEAEGLAAFAWLTPRYRDLRVVPRLVQLLEHVNGMVRTDAAKALAQLTLVPLEKVTPAEMRAWQARNRGKSAPAIWHEGLASRDPRIALAAATMAVEERDKDVVNALCLVLRCTDTRLVDQAHELLEKVTGNDWGCRSEIPPAERVKLVAKLERWWNAEKGRFQWVADRGSDGAKDEGLAVADTAVAAAVDPNRLLIEQLGSTDGLQSEHAETRILEAGGDCVPFLVNGLEDPNLVVRRKCNKLLKTIAKQDMGYDPRADAPAIAAAIAKWKAWAAAQQPAPTASPPAAATAPAGDDPRTDDPAPARPKRRRSSP